LRQIQYDQTYARKELETLREALEKRTTNLFRLQLGAITLTGALGFGAELLGSQPTSPQPLWSGAFT
jgi:hypothetical protein